jgi:hypothetical protein
MGKQDKKPQVAPASFGGAQGPFGREDLRQRGAMFFRFIEALKNSGKEKAMP